MNTSMRWGVGVVVLAGGIVGFIAMRSGEDAAPMPSEEQIPPPTERRLSDGPAETTPAEPRATAPQVRPAARRGSVPPQADKPPLRPPTDLNPPPRTAVNAPPGVIGARRTAPPGIDTNPPPTTLTAQIMQEAQAIMEIAGPGAERSARELLASADPEERHLGAVTLQEMDLLQLDDLDQLARDSEMAVPINSLGWLIDSGKTDQADHLTSLLIDQGMTTDTLIGVLAAVDVTESGKRAALELLRASLSEPKEVAAILTQVGEAAANSYGVRMKALALLRGTIPFEEYRARVEHIKATSEASDELWNEGINRLTSRLAGPVEIHAGTPTLGKADIDVMLAREFPMYLEDLAQQVEYALNAAGTYVQPGTSQHLAERIKQLKRQPRTTIDRVCLRRLESAVEALVALEDATLSPPPNFISMPPGIE